MNIFHIKTGVVIANHNSGRFFKNCYRGLMSQKVLPSIICVVDDGSKDNSLEEIEKVFPKFKYQTLHKTGIEEFSIGTVKFVIFKKEQGGPASARNVALNYLLDKVSVICINDIDDVYYPLKIHDSLEIMTKYDKVGLCFSDYETFNIKTGIKTREYKEPFSYNRLFEECIVSNNSIISTAVIKKIGLYDIQLYGMEDYDFWLRISDISSVYHIPRALYQYTITGQNITITTPKDEFARGVNIVKQKAMIRKQNARR